MINLDLTLFVSSCFMTSNYWIEAILKEDLRSNTKALAQSCLLLGGVRWKKEDRNMAIVENLSWMEFDSQSLDYQN